jgi:hypothetical protein
MTARCFPFTSSVTFRFWQFRIGHRNPSCGVIIFRMRDLKATTHEMFGNELGPILAGVMWLI